MSIDEAWKSEIIKYFPFMEEWKDQNPADFIKLLFSRLEVLPDHKNFFPETENTQTGNFFWTEEISKFISTFRILSFCLPASIVKRIKQYTKEKHDN